MFTVYGEDASKPKVFRFNANYRYGEPSAADVPEFERERLLGRAIWPKRIRLVPMVEEPGLSRERIVKAERAALVADGRVLARFVMADTGDCGPCFFGPDGISVYGSSFWRVHPADVERIQERWT